MNENLKANVIQTIEIDCAPGIMMQEPIMRAILNKDSKFPGYRKPVATFFGNWIWDFQNTPADEWALISAAAKHVLTDAYHNGQVRYASW